MSGATLEASSPRKVSLGRVLRLTSSAAERSGSRSLSGATLTQIALV